MARQAWDSAMGDEFPFRATGAGFLGALWKWLLGVVVVAALTAGTAYYLPLVRAHRALSVQYSALQKHADTDDASLKRLKSQLASVQADREKLRLREDQLEAKQQTEKERSGKLRDALATKLVAFTKSHVAVVARERGAAVLLPPALARMQGAALSEAGRNSLCIVVKAMSAVGPLTYRVGAYVAHADPAAAGPREEAASRAASAAKALEEQCAIPGPRILSAGFVLPSGDGTLGVDLLELEVALLDAAH